jgi:hypothetical protein
MIEEIEEEYVILRDLSGHQNMPAFFGIYLLRSPRSADQFWIAMEVPHDNVCFSSYSSILAHFVSIVDAG